MYPVHPDKKSIIKFQSRSFIKPLFPSILYTFDTNYDPNYTKNGFSYNYKGRIELIKEKIRFENYTKDQLIFLFEEMDKSYLWFKKRHWTSFNSLFDRVNRHNIRTAPEELQKLYTKQNLKNVRTIIIQRQKEFCNLYEDLKSDLLQDKKEILSTKKKNQLTANQIVILFDRLGVLTHPKIELISKVKQSELISKITGLNQKNIKSNIEKLDKKAIENGSKYQEDIDKINQILDDLT